MSSMLTLPVAEVCGFLGAYVAFTHKFLHVVKISHSEEQRPVAMGDSVCVVSLSFMITS